jgi:hypothetical protein
MTVLRKEHLFKMKKAATYKNTYLMGADASIGVRFTAISNDPFMELTLMTCERKMFFLNHVIARFRWS